MASQAWNSMFKLFVNLMFTLAVCANAPIFFGIVLYWLLDIQRLRQHPVGNHSKCLEASGRGQRVPPYACLSGSETCLYPIGSRVGAQGAQGVPVARPLRAAQVGRCGEDQQGKRVATLSAWEKQCEVEERVACELEGKGRVA